MSYNSNLPVDNTADIRENFRALKEDKIVDAATAVVSDSAAKLTTARKISLEGDATGSTSFDGSADVAIEVDVLSADTAAQCTGNAATATKLETARNINGVAFDGSADITITAEADGGNADTIGGYTPNNLMPLGAIIMWSGSIADIPSKWALCNGSNGTPDLRDRFVVGAGSTYAIGATGGRNEITLAKENLPSKALTGAFNGYYAMGYKSAWNGYWGTQTGYDAYSYASQLSASDNPSYIYFKSFANAITTSGWNSTAVENRPPYYALAYIMRIA